jgi:hypothetical protein
MPAFALNFPVALAAFFLMCALIHGRLTLPQVPVISEKLAWFARDRDEYDALFVGSSRFYHQIVPRQFDARVQAATGRPMRSFNAGCDGVWAPESFFFARQLLALKPAKLRWVFVELMDVNPNFDERDPTVRLAYWHDWQHTRMAWEKTAEVAQAIPALKRWELYRGHGTYFFQQWVGMGRGSEALQARLAYQKKKNAKPPQWAAEEGFLAEPDTPMQGANLLDFEKRMVGLRKGLPIKKMPPVLTKAVGELIADIQAAGAEPIFVITQTLNPHENFTNVPEGIRLLAFNDPRIYPALYEVDTHYDGWHLNRKGAAIFTDLLADRFCQPWRP